MPRGNRNRAYQSSDIVNAFMQMLHDGSTCLDDVRQLREELGLLSMLDISQLPDIEVTAIESHKRVAGYTLQNVSGPYADGRAHYRDQEDCGDRFPSRKRTAECGESGVHPAVRAALSEEVSVSHVRIDAASYQADEAPRTPGTWRSP